MKRAPPGLAALGVALALLTRGQALAAPAVPTQLPTGVEPRAYDLTVTPDLKALTFTGRETVTVEASRRVDRIVLNALGLEFGAASLDGVPAQAAVDPKTQTVSFATGRSIEPGRHTLSLDYAGRIADSATGFFHVDYAGGRMVTTQFEPADARRFAPLFDEPAKKAVFTLTAVIPKDLTAVSNMPEAAIEPAAEGLKRVRFAPTPRMSSYLLFLGVGDLERVSRKVDGTTVSVVIRRGDAAKAQYALEAAAELLPYYNDYFGVKYPLPKLDLVAAPGDVSGSMENWGAILFSQTNVVFDPKLSNVGDREEIFDVVAHEMAHLWSGDLVTMAWWDDLWLNEGFASWMSAKAAEHFHPEWRPILNALSDKDEAMLLDARPSSHPIVQRVATVAQAEQAFDAITYKKGEAVLRMLEAYAGPDAWRAGIRAYMAEHAYGNATSEDLWRAIDQATGKPVSAVARDFTTQPGVPLVRVASSPAGLSITETRLADDVVISGVNISASRMDLAALEARVLSWRAPLMLKPVRGGPAKARLLSRTSPQSDEAGEVVGAGQLGYYRVLYDSSALASLAEGFASLDAADQLGLLQDNLALGMAGQAPVGNYLRLTAALPQDADPAIWRAQARTLAGLDGYYARGPHRAAYRAWARQMLAPALTRVGFDARPSDSPAEAMLRETLLLGLSQLGDPRVAAEARRRFDGAHGDLSRLSADQRRWVLVGAARGADAATFEALRALAEAAKDPLERNDLYIDLAAVEDEDLARQVLALAITDEAPTNLAPTLVKEVAAVHPQLAWRFTLANLPAITRTLDTLGRSTFVPRVAQGSSDPKLAEQLAAYAKTMPADARGEAQVALARIRNNADIQARRLPQIDSWIAAHPAVAAAKPAD